MKKVTLFCYFLSVLGFIAPNVSYAIDLYALGSYWEVEDADGTWGAGVGVSVPLFSEFLRLDGRAYAFENSDIGGDDELELIPIDLGLQVHFLPEQTLDPYILGGASWIYADGDRIDVDSNVGAYVGGGLEFGLTKNLRLFGEAMYRIAELDSDFGSDDKIEINGITANAGLKLHF